MDELTSLTYSLVLLSALATILISLNFIKNQKVYAYEYTILILVSTLSAMLIASSYDLISMYLAIELQTLSFYVLAAFQRDSEFSTEAGLKYFVLGAVSSGLLLFGESIVYGSTGITNLEELTKLLTLAHDGTTAVNPLTGVETGLLLMLVAFLFKISAVPFHM